MKTDLLFIIAISLVFSSCKEGKPANDTVEDIPKIEKGSLEDIIEQHIEGNLKIPGTEDYSFKIYKEHLDGDDKMDAIITVNRLQFALDEAAKSDNSAKRAEFGFMGNHNYMFYYDGGLDKISPQIAIPSTPQAELKVSFEHVSSDAYKDILIDFRVRNASYKDFYTVSNHTPRRIFQWKNFDGLGSDVSEAFTFKIEEGAVGLQKDILVMKANIVQPKKKVDLFTFEPELTETNELVHRFFYNDQMGKYVTLKK
ncbi:MAG: hypothetical protein NWS40_08130 [Crocinitomicaceae bacterium]|nr:hypothetical protein [Crocinitomicaceae bacterium]MDP4684640.1 hypothetical protein [Crocinitomicaceae bacterium]MDP4798481.1 hypothetical protein [Crocinitomicaceae bacterium]MDP4865105.1 hypothetical protein [Crocinitomicaceae bacterium]